MSARHPDFPAIQQRLKALNLYSAPIDDEWGPGMARGVGELLLLAETAHGIKPPNWPKLDPDYAWLRDVGPLPRHLDFALHTFGVKEVPGPANCPEIMAWRSEMRDAGVKGIEGFSGDAVPWCGFWMRYVMWKTDRGGPDAPLWALNWSAWGEPGGQPELGDVLTFTRPGGGGHVAQYIAEDREGYYHVLGANQSDAVNIMRILKTRMVACRQPPYRSKPASVRPYIVAPTGRKSTNEA